MAKYTNEQIELIRAAYESGMKPKEIGTKYGVPAGTISSWANRGKWLQGVQVERNEEQAEVKGSEEQTEQSDNEGQQLNAEYQELINVLNNKVQELINENQKLINERDNLSEQLHRKQQKEHNERNAGRKVTLEYDVLIKEITSLYNELTPEGKRVNSQRAIADMLDVSLGTVNKVLQESKKE